MIVAKVTGGSVSQSPSTRSLRQAMTLATSRYTFNCVVKWFRCICTWSVWIFFNRCFC